MVKITIESIYNKDLKDLNNKRRLWILKYLLIQLTRVKMFNLDEDNEPSPNAMKENEKKILLSCSLIA